MRRIILAACCFLLSATIASAQYLNPGTPMCGGSPCFTASNPGVISGSFSATLSGFTPGGTFATLTAAGTSGSVALPAGTTVAIQNTGTTTVSCTLGVGSATAVANEIQVPANSTVFVTPGSNTFGACIDQTGSTSNTVVLAGGSGLGTGFGGGGGSGGGGGGAVFGPTAVGSAAANPPVLMGGTANAGATGTVQVAKVDSGGGLFANGLQGGSALSATNGWYTNILQGNAVLTAANGLYVNVGLGNAANASGNPLFAQLTAGSAAIGKVDPNTLASWGLATVGAGTAPTNAMVGGGVYNSGGVTLTTGQSAALQFTSAGSLHTTVDNTNANGPAAASASSPVTPSNNAVGSATIATNQVSVGSTATQIVATRTGVAGTGRVSVDICNTSTTDVWVGTSGVTTSTGQLLVGIKGACTTVKTTAAVYGIVATGTETVSFLENY